MVLWVYTTDFEKVAVIDTFESLIWTDRYQYAGDFELYMSPSNDLLQYLVKGYYIMSNESDHLMIIEGIKITSDIETGNHLTITGRSLESILDRRIIWDQTNFDNANLQNAIKKLLTNAIISPSDADRQISNFKFETSTDENITSLKLDAQYTGANLYNTISEICVANNIGFQIIPDDDWNFVFSLYCGEDHSYSQTALPHVVFSPRFENIINSNYLESDEKIKNVVLVAGEGEGSDRTKYSVGSSSGLARRELYVDARDLSSTTSDGTLSASVYKSMLINRGKEKLADYSVETYFEGKVESTQIFVFGTDYNVGDIVQIVNEYNVKARVRVTEVIRAQDINGFSTVPTFEAV